MEFRILIQVGIRPNSRSVRGDLIATRHHRGNEIRSIVWSSVDTGTLVRGHRDVGEKFPHFSILITSHFLNLSTGGRLSLFRQFFGDFPGLRFQTPSAYKLAGGRR